MTSEKPREDPESSRIILTTDMFAKAYTTMGESKAALTDVKDLLKDTNKRLRNINKRLNNLESSVKWIKWILMLGTPTLISVILRLLMG
jgi:hypothetical protein